MHLRHAFFHLVAVTALALLTACNTSGGRPASPAAIVPQHDATERIEQPAPLNGTPEQIIEHTGYVLSYNGDLCQPNWVAWELTDREAEGTLPRDDAFDADPLVPKARRVSAGDYRGSGYDRGHMVPAADMKWSAAAMRECFYMSNMCPQKHGLNAGPWAKLEEACRRWARREGAVYIVCGPIFKQGTPRATIGRGVKIGVPDAFFKVVLCLRPGREKAIGFLYDNRDGKQNMAEAARSVDDIEALTGMDFFPALPDDIENRLEAECVFKRWQ